MIVASNVLTLYSIVAVGSLSLFPCSFRLDGTWFRAVTNIHADDKHIRTHTDTQTSERAMYCIGIDTRKVNARVHLICTMQNDPFERGYRKEMGAGIFLSVAFFYL